MTDLANILRNFHRNSCYPEAMDGEVSAAIAAIHRVMAAELRNRATDEGTTEGDHNAMRLVAYIIEGWNEG